MQCFQNRTNSPASGNSHQVICFEHVPHSFFIFCTQELPQSQYFQSVPHSFKNTRVGIPPGLRKRPAAPSSHELRFVDLALVSLQRRSSSLRGVLHRRKNIHTPHCLTGTRRPLRIISNVSRGRVETSLIWRRKRVAAGPEVGENGVGERMANERRIL